MYSIEEFDIAKTKVLRYISYKKRTVQEVKSKFSNSIGEDLLSDIILYLREIDYLNDEEYIKKIIKEFISLKNLSIKEVKNKLYTKGLSRDLIEEYLSNNSEIMYNYEIRSAKRLVVKKNSNMKQEEIISYLLKKGYTKDSIDIALEEV